MEDNTLKLIEKLKNNKALAQSLLQSGDGARLVELLSAGDNGAALSEAADSAAGGDTQKLASMLGGMLRSAEGAALLRRLNDTMRQ